MIYKNISTCKKQFYGVPFNPGETKEVPGYVNDAKMILSTLPEEEKDKKASKQPTQKSQHSKSADAVVLESNNIKEEETNG